MLTPRTFTNAFFSIMLLGLPIAASITFAMDVGLLTPAIPLETNIDSLILVLLLLPPVCVPLLAAIPLMINFPNITAWLYAGIYFGYGAFIGEGLGQSLALGSAIGGFMFFLVRREMDRSIDPYIDFSLMQK